MNDDIFERLIKSIGIVFGGYFVMYLMIITTQKQPRGIALKIVMVTEFALKGLFYILLVTGISFFVAALIENYFSKKRNKEEEQAQLERERQSELVYLKQEIESLKRRLNEANKEKTKFVVAFHEEQTRRVEFETHLKNRTAKAAVDEALRHFL